MSLAEERVEEVLAALAPAERAGASAGTPRSARTPVHVVYGGAHLYRADSVARVGAIARATMETWGKDDARFGAMLGITDPALASEVTARVRAKLASAPLEKSCIDFEDGYGPRGDAEEDAEAVRTAGDLARASAPRAGAPQATNAHANPIVGIRIKALAAPTARRALRTLDLFVTALARATGGVVPEGFTVTLPKVTRHAEVSALAELLGTLESKLGLPAASIGIELMIEAPRALVDRTGRVALPALVAAADGRCVAAHLGAYDLTASLGVTAGEQRLDHPACDVARMLMQLSLAGTGVEVVDGATTVLPIGRHREAPGAKLTDAQRASNAEDVLGACALHAMAVRRALGVGIYQGWDLHPAQLPARYGAVYAFFLAERAAMAERLAAFVAKATQATRSGRVFDDAATGQGLLEFFARGVACGALSEDDVRVTTLTLDEVRARSFERIVAARAVTVPE
jgi:citrate lyase beta subunit